MIGNVDLLNLNTTSIRFDILTKGLLCAICRDLEDDRGDPFMIVRVYHEWLQLKLDDTESSQRWCRRRGVEEQRLYELTKLRSQFLRILKVRIIQHGVKSSS